MAENDDIKDIKLLDSRGKAESEVDRVRLKLEEIKLKLSSDTLRPTAIPGLVFLAQKYIVHAQNLIGTGGPAEGYNLAMMAELSTNISQTAINTQNNNHVVPAVVLPTVGSEEAEAEAKKEAERKAAEKAKAEQKAEGAKAESKSIFAVLAKLAKFEPKYANMSDDDIRSLDVAQLERDAVKNMANIVVAQAALDILKENKADIKDAVVKQAEMHPELQHLDHSAPNIFEVIANYVKNLHRNPEYKPDAEMRKIMDGVKAHDQIVQKEESIKPDLEARKLENNRLLPIAIEKGAVITQEKVRNEVNQIAGQELAAAPRLQERIDQHIDAKVAEVQEKAAPSQEKVANAREHVDNLLLVLDIEPSDFKGNLKDVLNLATESANKPGSDLLQDQFFLDNYKELSELCKNKSIAELKVNNEEPPQKAAIAGIAQEVSSTKSAASESLATNKNKAQAPITDEAMEALQKEVNSYYDMFINSVAKGRGVSASAVRGGYGEGRVLNAKDAKAEGMVDRIDTLDGVLARLGVGNNSPKTNMAMAARKLKLLGA